jgi:hypothetical protein
MDDFRDTKCDAPISQWVEMVQSSNDSPWRDNLEIPFDSAMISSPLFLVTASVATERSCREWPVPYLCNAAFRLKDNVVESVFLY